MKSPDITLCLQVVHFFIVYYMLRTYVFYPAMKILVKNDQQAKKMQNAINDITLQKEVMEQHKQSRWLQIKKMLHSIVPSSSYKFFTIKLPKMKCSLVYDEQTKILESDRKKIKKIINDSLSDINV